MSRSLFIFLVHEEYFRSDRLVYCEYLQIRRDYMTGDCSFWLDTHTDAHAACVMHGGVLDEIFIEMAGRRVSAAGVTS
jgi:hypothetical protein